MIENSDDNFVRSSAALLTGDRSPSYFKRSKVKILAVFLATAAILGATFFQGQVLFSEDGLFLAAS